MDRRPRRTRAKASRCPGGRRGLVHLYTGGGKGKTTAAWGLALRAAGHGLRVKVIEFLKGPRECGEHLAAGALRSRISVETCGAGFCRRADGVHRAAARRALERSRAALASGRWDLVVLDEAAAAAALGLFSPRDLLRALAGRAPRVEAVVTGRAAPRKLRALADYVTEMRELRHPFRKGTRARRGIEF